MATIYLSLGSNLGNRHDNMKKAIVLIEQQVGTIAKQSSYFETASWGVESKNLYINQVIAVDTLLGPFNLLDNILKIEQQLGRIRDTKNQYADRIIDIDILFYDDIVLQSDVLVIPHPYIASRRFVLEPLQEIDPEFVHPVLNKTINQLLKECDDKLMVRKL